MSAAARRPRRKAAPADSTCIGCGCTDSAACGDELFGTCGWLHVDRKQGLGVCSACPKATTRWKRGDRALRTDRT